MNLKTWTIVGSVLLTILYSMMFQWFLHLDSSQTQSVLLLSEESYALYWLQAGVFKEEASSLSLKRTLNEHGIEFAEVNVNDMMILVISPTSDHSAITTMMETCQSLGIEVLMKQTALSKKQKQQIDQGDIVSVLKEVMAS